MAKRPYTTIPRPNIPPRMQFAGFEPVERTSTRYSKRNFKVPKPGLKGGAMNLNERKLSKLFGRLASRDYKALARIVETADLIEAAGRLWLLAPADINLIRDLSMFGEQTADMEPEEDDDQDNDSGGYCANGYSEDAEPEHAF